VHVSTVPVSESALSVTPFTSAHVVGQCVQMHSVGSVDEPTSTLCAHITSQLMPKVHVDL
jgi:hypothetical protein